MQSVNNQNIYVASPDSQFVQGGNQKPAEGSFKKVAAVTAIAALIGTGLARSQLLDKDNMVGTITEKFMGTSSDLPEDTFQQYLNFIAKYGKTSQSQEEFEHRLSVFGKNYKRIIEHNALDAPFTMAINQFADMTDEEFISSKAGLIVPKSRSDQFKDFKFEIEEPESTHLGDKFSSFLHVEKTDAKQKSNSTIPDYKNWYEEGHVTEPENQSSCGGCWAFSSAAATESLAHIHGLDKKLMEYSVQQLIDCDVANFACAGGWMYEGFNYISNNGVLLKKDYRPYQSNKHDCETS